MLKGDEKSGLDHPALSQPFRSPAARHLKHYPASQMRSARPARFARAHLLHIARPLPTMLARETQPRRSLTSFVGDHLRVRDSPVALLEALSPGDLNLCRTAGPASQPGIEASAQHGRSPHVVRCPELSQAYRQPRLSDAGLRRHVTALLGST